MCLRRSPHGHQRIELVDTRARGGGVRLESLDDVGKIGHVLAKRLWQRAIEIGCRDAKRHLGGSIVELRDRSCVLRRQQLCRPLADAAIPDP